MSNNHWINRSFTIVCLMTELFKCKQFIRKNMGHVRSEKQRKTWVEPHSCALAREVFRHTYVSKLFRYILIFEIKIVIPSLPLTYVSLFFPLGHWLGPVAYASLRGLSSWLLHISPFSFTYLWFFSYLGLLRNHFSLGALLTSALLKSLFYMFLNDYSLGGKNISQLSDLN